MKDWRNTLVGTLAGALITFAVMFVSITKGMVTEDELQNLATKSEITIVQNSIRNSMNNHTRALENLAKEVHNLREQVGKLEGQISVLNDI